MKTLVERLEGRTLLTATLPFGVTPSGTLEIKGTSVADVIEVTSSGHTFIVSFNALKGFSFREGVKRVRIEGDDGNDRITYAGKSLAPVIISGGTGRDRLKGTGPHVTPRWRRGER